jgi:WD40 repeat protein
MPLSLVSAIGFSGKIQNGLLVDSIRSLAYYPMGSSVVIWPFDKPNDGQKSFLTGHTYLIGAIALSDSGNYLATGETDVVGTKVQVIIWDTVRLTNVGSHLLHHASVAAIGISPNDKYVASAGKFKINQIILVSIALLLSICKSKIINVGDCLNHL